MKSLVWGPFISKMPRRCRQAYCTVELINIPLPKPTSSPTLSSVWEKWEIILLRLGRANLNGIRKTFTTTIWIESMECGRSSSGKYSQESQRWDSSRRFKNLQCEPEHFGGRIIFMSMFNDIVWDAKGNKEQCEYNSQAVAKYARKFPRGHWSFLGPGSEENGVGARGSVALRVRSCSYPRHTDCHHLYQMCVDEPKPMCSISCMSYIALSPTSMDEVLFGSVWNTASSTSDTDDVIRVRVAATCWNDGGRYGKLGKKNLPIVAQRTIREALVSRCWGLHIVHVEMSTHGKFSKNGPTGGRGVHSASRLL